MKKKGLLIALMGLFAFSCGKKATNNSAKAQEQQKAKPKKETALKCVPGPDFKVKDINGKTVSLSDYKGKVVVLQFFGVHCPMCRQEIPVLEQIYKKYKGKVVIIGMNADGSAVTRSELEQFATAMGITYPVVHAPDKLWYEYPGKFTGQDIIPQTFFINKKGQVCFFGMGFRKDLAPKYYHAIDLLLNQKG